MKKLYFSSFLVFIFAISFSQTFPYLNASAANENEFPVDKDTNIYMFHGNRLVKTDKNFNTKWANTYSGFTFFSVLLSKTGSIYFIGKNGSINVYFGKINASGNLSWIRTVQSLSATVGSTVFTSASSYCKRLILDRNNNLVVSGEMQSIGNYPNVSNSFILKTDTNGNALKFRAIKSDYFVNFSILNDSSGVYKLIGSGSYLGGIALGFFNYSDVSDSFATNKWGGITPGNSSVNWQVYKSKINSSFYIDASISTSVTTQNGVIKLTENGLVKWAKGINQNSAYSTAGRIEENMNGDVFYSVACGPGPCTTYTSSFVKIDSNGVANNFLTTMLNGYNIGPSFPSPIPAHSQRVIYNGNYYFDISGYSFPMNPLTIQKFGSSLTYPCSSTITIVYPPISFSNLMPSTTPTIIPVSSYTLNPYTSSTTPVTFSVNPNFCSVLGVGEINQNGNELIIYPNPSNEKIFITENNFSINSIDIFDVNGKSVKNYSNVSSIDIKDLSNGVYFIRIKTDKGEFNRKFIKE